MQKFRETSNLPINSIINLLENKVLKKWQTALGVRRRNLRRCLRKNFLFDEMKIVRRYHYEKRRKGDVFLLSREKSWNDRWQMWLLDSSTKNCVLGHRLIKICFPCSVAVWLKITLKNYTKRCKKLATIVLGRKNAARLFFRRKQVSTSAEM